MTSKTNNSKINMIEDIVKEHTKQLNEIMSDLYDDRPGRPGLFKQMESMKKQLNEGFKTIIDKMQEQFEEQNKKIMPLQNSIMKSDWIKKTIFSVVGFIGIGNLIIIIKAFLQ